MLKYKIIDRHTGQEIPDFDCIVTQDGLVAWWDEGHGWRADENQDNFHVQLVEYSSPVEDVDYKDFHEGFEKALQTRTRPNAQIKSTEKP